MLRLFTIGCHLSKPITRQEGNSRPPLIYKIPWFKSHLSLLEAHTHQSTVWGWWNRCIAILDTITIIRWAMSCGFCCFFQLYRRTISSFTWDRLFTNQVLDINYWFCQVRWFLVKIPKFNTGFNNHVLATFAQPNHRLGQLGRVDWETGCGIVMRGLKDLGWLCGLGEALGVTFAAAGDSTPVRLPCLCSDIGVGWHW